MSHRTPVIVILTLLSSLATVAQDRAMSWYPTPIARNAVFIEAGGNGLGISVNYEHKILPHVGLRAGAGYIYATATTVPIMVNYYVGKRYMLELGAGAVYLPVWESTAKFGEAKTTLLAFTVGHKYQDPSGGILFRISVTPLYSFTGARGKFFGGVSLGYAF